jgi:glycosyltransferase involved in cell wall biosynthesis
MNWQIVTCEYPPQTGGVSDYTRLLAHQLRLAGDEVEVFAPRDDHEPETLNDHGIVIHRALGGFSSSDFARTNPLLNTQSTLLVQWVPHGYGYRAMNLGFCRWIEHLSRRGHRVFLMIHEPMLEFSGSWKQRLVSLVHRRMLRTLLRSSSRVFLSIPGWERYLRRYAPPGQTFEWLPVPSTIPVASSPFSTAEIRHRLCAAAPHISLPLGDVGSHDCLLGHLGTYSAEVTRFLRPALLILLNELPGLHLLLLGNSSKHFAVNLVTAVPRFRHRIHPTGTLPDLDLSHHIAACDLMLQPYPDGLSTRRTSLMNALAHNIAVVSNTGHLTEDFWHTSDAAALSPVSEPHRLAEDCLRLLRNPEERARLAHNGLALYRSRFDWPHLIARLRSSTAPPSAHSK